MGIPDEIKSAGQLRASSANFIHKRGYKYTLVSGVAGLTVAFTELGSPSLAAHGGCLAGSAGGRVETGSGLLLALGFLTPAAAAAFSVMLVAGVSVHFKHGFLVRGEVRFYNYKTAENAKDLVSPVKPHKASRIVG